MASPQWLFFIVLARGFRATVSGREKNQFCKGQIQLYGEVLAEFSKVLRAIFVCLICNRVFRLFQRRFSPDLPQGLIVLRGKNTADLVDRFFYMLLSSGQDQYFRNAETDKPNCFLADRAYTLYRFQRQETPSIGSSTTEKKPYLPCNA